MVMTMCIADFAIEWLRPLPPSYKLIGAVLPEPAQPLPADLEVGSPTAQIEQTWPRPARVDGDYVASTTLGLEELNAAQAGFTNCPAITSHALHAETSGVTGLPGFHALCSS
jgi:hypothetical protein